MGCFMKSIAVTVADRQLRVKLPDNHFPQIELGRDNTDFSGPNQRWPQNRFHWDSLWPFFPVSPA
jgi:hypothetical protein